MGYTVDLMLVVIRGFFPVSFEFYTPYTFFCPLHRVDSLVDQELNLLRNRSPEGKGCFFS